MIKPYEKREVGFFSRMYLKYFQVVSEEERFITNDGEVQPQNFISNKMNNRKYTLLSFLPLFLFDQYKHFQNFYFLAIAMSQFIPIFKVGLLITYFFPIIIITGISLIKEIYDEIKKLLKDKQLNQE